MVTVRMQKKRIIKITIIHGLTDQGAPLLEFTEGIGSKVEGVLPHFQ